MASIAELKDQIQALKNASTPEERARRTELTRELQRAVGEVQSVAAARGATPQQVAAISHDVIVHPERQAGFLAGTETGVIFGQGRTDVPPTQAPPPALRTAEQNQQIFVQGKPESEVFPTSPPPPPPPPPGDPMDAFTKAMEGFLANQAQMIDEIRKQSAVTAALQKAQQDSTLAQGAGQQQLSAMETLSKPGANYFSQFARSPRGTQIPLDAELAALIGGREIPGFGTIGGNINTIPNDPAIIAGAFEDAIRGMTSSTFGSLSPQGLERLFTLGRIGGLDPTAMWQEREKAIPRAGRLIGSAIV